MHHSVADRRPGEASLVQPLRHPKRSSSSLALAPHWRRFLRAQGLVDRNKALRSFTSSPSCRGSNATSVGHSPDKDERYGLCEPARITRKNICDRFKLNLGSFCHFTEEGRSPEPRRFEEETKMCNAPQEKELVVPLASEELRLEKRETSTGKVRVQTVVETVDELARATVEEDSLDVRRVPVGKVVAEPPCIRTEGDVTIIPVIKETMIVEKRLVLVEEVHIRHTTSSRQVEMPVTLRKQKAVIDSIPSDRQTGDRKTDGHNLAIKATKARAGAEPR